jgi:hypothetical protein
MTSSKIIVGLLACAAGGVAQNQAQGQVQLRVSVQNLSPANSLSFAPLRVGFHNGTFDSFNNGQTASDAIVSIAEGGSGSAWFPAFSAAEPNATLGSVMPGPLLPGATVSSTFTVNPAVNPQQYMLFDAMGNLNINTISQFGRDIWDAGSEIEDPANAAFLVGGVNANRTPQNGVVNFNFTQLDRFNGLTTAAGYVFDRQISASTEVYRISFEVIPAPGATALLGIGGIAALRRRRR